MEMMRNIHDSAGAGANGVMEGNEADASGAAEVDMDDCSSLALPPDLPPYSGDYIISDYMERLGTRLNILETELKYAWRALDLLSQEYVRMWERLERLETLLADQQGVISTLLDFYTCRNFSNSDPMTQLDVIKEILGNGSVEDGIEEGLDIGRSTVLLDPQDERMQSNEAFYKSLNQAYREDLVCDETSRPVSQLDMIWEAPEENEMDLMPSSSTRAYSATDYKDYRGMQGGSCITERDLVHLTTLSSLDQATVEKLHELDRLTTQLHKDSRELQDLKSRMLSPEVKSLQKQLDREIEAKALVEDGNIINEQLRNVYPGSERWGINEMIKGFDDFGLTTPKDILSEKSPSRLSLCENVASERGADYNMSTAISPRRKYVHERTTTEPYTTVTGRLAYSSAVANAEINAAKSSKSPSALSRERFEFGQYQLSDASKQNFYGSKGMIPSVDDVYKGQVSPVMSLHDTYSHPPESELNLNYADSRFQKSPSPPPPAPPNGKHLFAAGEAHPESSSGHSSTLTAGNLMSAEGLRLSPRSPKSPKMSPKHVKKDNNIVAAKSDSGLSSMSGWSSLEKSPSSPKPGKVGHSSHDYHKIRMPSPQQAHRMTYEVDSKPYLETLVDSYTYEGTKIVRSDYNSKQPEQLTREIYSSRDSNRMQVNNEHSLMKSEVKHSKPVKLSPQMIVSDMYYGSEVPSIYSVAGNRQTVFTTVDSSARGLLPDHRSFSELLDSNEIKSSTPKSADSYPPEPSYHAETVVMSAAANKKALTRTNTVSSGDPSLQPNGFKNSARNIYPHSNITDALSYYPTSNRFDDGHKSGFDDQSSWQGGVSRSPTSSMETSSLKSHSLNITERKQYTNQLQQEYFKQQQYDQRNGSVMYDSQNFNDNQIPVDHNNVRIEQYKGPSGILVSESGYLSISSDLRSKHIEKAPKKPKRTSSLKSAMSSMSHWLPDLHLPKKHRSHSLPSGVDSVDQPQQEKTLKERMLSAQRRKKKYQLVASMSGLLQKARRKNQSSHQSLSDPETSETEWSGGRSSAQSEDSDSVFSDTAHDNNVFVKISSKPKQRKLNNQDIVEQQQKIQDLQQRGRDYPTEADDFECIKEENETNVTNKMPRDKSDDIDFHFARISQMQNDQIPKLEKLDIDTDISNIDLYEEESMETDAKSPTSLFATIGDVKKASSTGSTEDETENNKSYASGPPMEFAVSRAIGKYRLRKSSSISDDQTSDSSPPKVETEPPSEQFSVVKERKPTKIQAPEIISSTVSDEPTIFTERSPSVQSSRGMGQRFQPRHQQSLEIPNKHDDDDSKSTHSWRSGSRVSSRRQSTEDSIDSEDEWYCYELRKLEEMEHQTFIENERQQTLAEEPEIEEIFSQEPDESLKEHMAYVLRELKLKTASMKTKFDETPVKETWKDITTFPELIERTEEPLDDEDDEQKEEDRSYDESSGETSGPDSPVQSGDELDEDYEQLEIMPQLTSKEVVAVPQDVPVGSKWKLLKALKDRKAEEKTSESPVATTPSTEKDKVSAGVSYLMQKFHEIRVKS